MKIKTVLATTLLLSLVVFMYGCSGGGGQSSAGVSTGTQGPEAAVVEILDSWRQSSIAFAVSPQGEITTSEPATESTQNYINFKDLSGETWRLLIGEVVYVATDKARVNTFYYSSSADQGGLKVIFIMIRDQGIWYLDDLEIEQIPAVVVVGTGIKGVITDKNTAIPVSGAKVEAYNQATNVLAGTATTEPNGFYSILNLNPGTYYLVIGRDGYESYTIRDVVVN